MRAFVFTDKALTRQAGRFVWLAIDTEKAKNAPIRKRLGVQALPTYFVIDPASERVALRWVGGATVERLQKILDEGSRAVAASSGAARPGAGAPGSAERALERADRLYGEGSYADAAKAFQEALAAAPAGWAPYGRVVESLMFALQMTDQCEPAIALATEAWPRLARSSSAPTVAGTALDCAVSQPESLAQRTTRIAECEARARAVLADRSIPMAADDRSGLYISVLEARKDAKDEAGARKVATEWLAFLDGEAAKAKSPEARAVFDSHRLSACLELGEPARAIPMLEASERDFPEDYNPPARLAVTYRALKRWPEALAASDRAMARAYGPRKLGMYQVRADIYTGLSDMGAARRTLEEAIAFADSLPPGQRSEGAIAGLRKKLEALGPAVAR